MTTALVYKSTLQGELKVPASKSHSQRVLIMAMLHPAKVRVLHMGQSEDELTVLKLIQQCGVKLEQISVDEYVIGGGFDVGQMYSLDCGESGLAARVFSCLAALSDHEITITGKRSLEGRDMSDLKRVLNSVGVKCELKDGKLPAKISGPYKYEEQICLPRLGTSQVISGVLMAIGAQSGKSIRILVPEAVSKPYIELTLEVMGLFGCKVRHDDFAVFEIHPRENQSLGDVEVTIEGDWSSAAFPMVAAAIGGDIFFKGLNLQSCQSDRILIELLKSTGVSVEVENTGFRIHSGEKTSAFHIDLTDSPDLFPALAVLAAFSSGTSELKGVSRLEGKESNRAKSISALLDVMQISHEIKNDILLIQGGYPLGGRVDVYGDHRIAMAAAVAGLFTDQPMVINHAEVVAKSFPSFFQELKMLGASVTLD